MITIFISNKQANNANFSHFFGGIFFEGFLDNNFCCQLVIVMKYSCKLLILPSKNQRKGLLILSIIILLIASF